jgi:LacI family transcriptional regulator
MVKYCLEGGRNIEEISTALKEFRSAAVDAIIIASDQISISTMRVLSKTTETEKLTIIGFSNSDVIDLLSPRISYINKMLLKSVKLLLRC